MAKKTKTAKALPSALTLSSSTQPNSQATLATATASQASAVKASAPTPKRQPLTTPGTASAKPSPLAATPSAPKPTVEEKTASPKASQTLKVTFALLEPHAQRVAVSGEFNGWSTDTTFLKKQNDGRWETTLALPPGRHEYKFVVDGQWIPDPNAPEQAFNGHGTLNSVVEVRG
jgi:hypothetical protein